MLSKVKRPDGREVFFEYDALGRRTAKIYNGEITRFVWDGNVLMHEWKYDEKDRPQLIIDEEGNVEKSQEESIENLVTWVYEKGNYVPSGKIIDGQKFSIILDYIGRPIQSFDEEGNLVWSTEYDIFGGLKNLKGNKNFMPFRQLGQYEDEGLGWLYYNRFRYYDSEQGNYISKDPIGLLGNNPNLYAFVVDTNNWVDIFGLGPTDPIDRAFLKEFLGTNAKDGGAYMFRTLDVRDGLEKWYAGKAKNLYQRLRTHLGSGKLDPGKLGTVGVIIIPHGTDADFFKTEADLMKKFEDFGEDLANKINSPGCK